MRMKLEIAKLGADTMSVLRSVGYLVTMVVAFIWLLVRGGRFVK
jgi:hypothetical protein